MCHFVQSDRDGYENGCLLYRFYDPVESIFSDDGYNDTLGASPQGCGSYRGSHRGSLQTPPTRNVNLGHYQDAQQEIISQPKIIKSNGAKNGVTGFLWYVHCATVCSLVIACMPVVLIWRKHTQDTAVGSCRMCI